MELLNLLIRAVAFFFAIFLFIKFSAIYFKYGVQITKFVLSLIIGGNIANSVVLVESGSGWNILAWTGIFFALFSILFIMPRTKCSITFMCNLAVVALVIYGLILTALPDIIPAFEVTRIVNFIACIVCYIVSFVLMTKQISFSLFTDLKSKILRMIDRIISSLFYSLAILIVFTFFLFSQPTFDSELLFFLIWAAVYAAVFIADLLSFDNLLRTAELNYVSSEDTYQAISGFANNFDSLGITKDPEIYDWKKTYNSDGTYDLVYEKNDRKEAKRDRRRAKEQKQERERREAEYRQHIQNKRR